MLKIQVHSIMEMDTSPIPGMNPQFKLYQVLVL